MRTAHAAPLCERRGGNVLRAEALDEAVARSGEFAKRKEGRK